MIEAEHSAAELDASLQLLRVLHDNFAQSSLSGDAHDANGNGNDNKSGNDK